MESGDTSKIGMYLVPWTCDTDNENFIQEDCKATIRSVSQSVSTDRDEKDVSVAVFKEDMASSMGVPVSPVLGKCEGQYARLV